MSLVQLKMYNYKKFTLLVPCTQNLIQFYKKCRKNTLIIIMMIIIVIIDSILLASELK